MAGTNKGAEDILALGKQFWDTWSGFAQGAAPGGTPSWGSPMDAFSNASQSLPDDAKQAIDSLGEHGRQFLQFMQAAAAQMGAGNSLGAGDVASLWQRSMSDVNPSLDALRAAASESLRGFENSGRDMQELLAPLRQEWNSMLRQPAFGQAREKQEASQELMRAFTEHAEANAAYSTLLLKSSQRGMEYFENKLAERSEPGRQIESARALYDLWIDAAEEGYAEVAMSPEFRTVYAELVNSQMRLKRAQQAQIERQAAEWGLPTRSELDGTHQKIKALRKESRELRQRLAQLEAQLGAKASGTSSSAPAAADNKAKATKSAPRKRAKPAAKATQATAPKAKAKTATSSKRGARAAPRVVDLTDVASGKKTSAKSAAKKSARKRKES